MSRRRIHVPLDEMTVDEAIHFVEITKHDVKQRRGRQIPIALVRWDSENCPDFTWERKDQMRAKYPQLFASTSS